MAETILQLPIFSDFIFPFLLVFFITFALLRKTKILGTEVQIDSMVAFVIGLIVVGVAFPKLVISNMILFLTVAIIISFVGLLLWGFVTGEESPKVSGTGFKWVAGILILVAVILATVWATGFDYTGTFGFLFQSSWSSSFWTSVAFLVAIGVALGVVIGTSGGSGGSSGGE